MKIVRSALLLLVIVLLCVPASAFEIRLRDGKVIEAESYTLTGSYLMVKMANGAQMAYDVADVDLEALRAAEAAAEAALAEQAATAEEAVQPDLVGNRTLSLPPEEAESSGVTITDEDVRRFKPQGEEGAEGGEAAAPEGPPEGYEEGGRVVINNLRVSSLGEGRWLVEGDIVNRSPNPVNNVRVALQTVADAGDGPWSAELSVTNNLPPDEVAVFSREFQAVAPEDKAHPDIKASVYWMGAPSTSRGQAPAGRVPGPMGPVPTPEL